MFFERYMHGGKVYFQVYNSWVNRQTMYESLSGDAVASQPMNVRAFKKFIQALKTSKENSKIQFRDYIFNTATLQKYPKEPPLETRPRVGHYSSVLLNQHQEGGSNSDVSSDSWNP